MTLKLPDAIKACLLDLDGVLTPTARIHASAWKDAFDAVLASRSDDQAPFDATSDYEQYVDGKSREDGVRSFLSSRGIDATDALVAEIADRKTDSFMKVLHDDGIEPYPGSRRFVDAARDAGLQVAVVSSSRNAEPVLEAAGILDRFATVVDGNVIAEAGLAGKPAPDAFLEGARRLGVEPAAAAVFEDALAGVEAGRAGHFGTVVGVDRIGHADALREHGADVVVADLADLLA